MTATEWKYRFGEKLHKLMIEKGFNTIMLEARTGIDNSTIYRYLRMIRNPSAINVLNLAYALGVDVSELIDFGEPVRADYVEQIDIYKAIREEQGDGL